MPARLARNPVALLAGGIGLSVAGRALWRWLRAMDLRGQVVVITGSSRGLGFAMAQEFARKGARLVICARNEGDLEKARRALVDQGAQVLAVPCDIRDREQAQHLIDQATARFGRVDVLVNNAGTIMTGPIWDQTLQDLEEAMEIMFWGTVYTTMAVLPQMYERKSGRVVNITSVGGKVSVPHLLPYCSAKFAAVGFSEGLHAELDKDGITVTTVVPGLMRTGSHVNALFKGRHRAEYTWFTLGASLPVTAMSARRAARQIVRAAQRGDPEIMLGLETQVLARLAGLFPGMTARALSLVNRLLPKEGGIGRERRLGRESETRVTQSFLTTLGQRAARQYQRHLETIAKD
jgi:short-subunit dehydrogenase